MLSVAISDVCCSVKLRIRCLDVLGYLCLIRRSCARHLILNTCMATEILKEGRKKRCVVKTDWPHPVSIGGEGQGVKTNLLPIEGPFSGHFGRNGSPYGSGLRRRKEKNKDGRKS